MEVWGMELIAMFVVFIIALGLVVWPDASCGNFLTDFTADRLKTGNYVYRVYTNNVTPGTATAIGDFTEASWAGYVAVQGTAITWSAPAVTNHVASTDGSAIAFTNSSGAPVTCYGIFVTNPAKTVLYFTERDSNAPVTVPDGAQYLYQPNQQFRSIN
jgi:hypothetical protein